MPAASGKSRCPTRLRCRHQRGNVSVGWIDQEPRAAVLRAVDFVPVLGAAPRITGKQWHVRGVDARRGTLLTCTHDVGKLGVVYFFKRPALELTGLLHRNAVLILVR